MKFQKVKRFLRTARALGVAQAAEIYSSGRPGEKISLKYTDGHSLTLRKGTSDIDTLYQIGVRQEMRIPVNYTSPRIIDAGSNIGISIREFLEIFPGSSIAGVEPAPDNYSLLQENTKEFAKVTLMPAAVWYRHEMLQIENPEAEPWGYRTCPGSGTAGKIAVPGLTIESILKRMGWDRCEILKLDIEGAEREVLNFSSNWIDKVDCLLVETHDRYRAGCTNAVAKAAIGFPYRTIVGEKHLYSRHPFNTKVNRFGKIAG